MRHPAPQDGLPAAVSGRSALAVAEEVVREAGRVVRAWFQGVTGNESDGGIQVSFKGRNDLVTNVDRMVEAAAADLLAKEYPAFGLLAEESGRKPGKTSYSWILDPLDGTRNFANGTPHFAVNLALAKGDAPLLGLTYDPIREELFHAEAGRGAFLNGKRLWVSGTGSLGQSVLGFDLGYVDEQAAHLLDMLHGLWPRMQAVRITGSAALGLAYVAAGRYQLYAHHHLWPWDVAPGVLLVREAGGVVTDLRGIPASVHAGGFVAANPAVHQEFMKATEGSSWRDIG